MKGTCRKNSKSTQWRTNNGRFHHTPSLSDFCDNYSGQLEECAECGHQWTPVLKTGYCPKCSSQNKIPAHPSEHDIKSNCCLLLSQLVSKVSQATKEDLDVISAVDRHVGIIDSNKQIVALTGNPYDFDSFIHAYCLAALNPVETKKQSIAIMNFILSSQTAKDIEDLRCYVESFESNIAINGIIPPFKSLIENRLNGVINNTFTSDKWHTGVIQFNTKDIDHNDWLKIETNGVIKVLFNKYTILNVKGSVYSDLPMFITNAIIEEPTFKQTLIQIKRLNELDRSGWEKFAQQLNK